MATIEERLKAVEQYIQERKEQQITSPLDPKSLAILNEYFLSVTRAFLFTNPSGFDFVYLVAKQGPYTAVLSGQNNLIGYVPVVATDFLNAGSNIITGEQINDIPDGTMITFWSTGTMPGGLSTGGALYYVVNSTGPTFKVSLTLGGAAINITSAGDGEQFFEILG